MSPDGVDGYLNKLLLLSTQSVGVGSVLPIRPADYLSVSTSTEIIQASSDSPVEDQKMKYSSPRLIKPIACETIASRIYSYTIHKPHDGLRLMKPIAL